MRLGQKKVTPIEFEYNESKDGSHNFGAFFYCNERKWTLRPVYAGYKTRAEAVKASSTKFKECEKVRKAFIANYEGEII